MDLSHDAAVFRRLAISLGARDELEDAEQAATLSLQLDDDSAETWALLGSVRARRKRYEEAIAPYLEALRRAPTDIRTWTNLGEVYLVLMDYDKATRALEQAMRLDPKAQHPAGRRARVVVASTIRSLQSKS